MSWLITYQEYNYVQPQGKVQTVVVEEHPIEFQRRHTGEYGNWSCAILFAMEVPADIVEACS